MARSPECARFDGLGLAELVRKGEVSPLDLVDEAIARIEAHDGRINAVVTRTFEQARAAARGPRRGHAFVPGGFAIGKRISVSVSSGGVVGSE